jgi:hypothetical protein
MNKPSHSVRLPDEPIHEGPRHDRRTLASTMRYALWVQPATPRMSQLLTNLTSCRSVLLANSTGEYQ